MYSDPWSRSCDRSTAATRPAAAAGTDRYARAEGEARLALLLTSCQSIYGSTR